MEGSGMSRMTRALTMVMAMSSFVAIARQEPPAASAGQAESGRGGRSGGPQPPPVPSISQRPTGSSLGTIRLGAADGNIWFGWRVAIPAAVFGQLTFSEALAKSDMLSVAGVEASNAQIVSAEVPKPFDFRLQPGERNAVMYRLRELNQQVLTYRVDRFPSDKATR